jgi:hypothetical protein
MSLVRIKWKRPYIPAEYSTFLKIPADEIRRAAYEQYSAKRHNVVAALRNSGKPERQRVVFL